MEKGPMLYQTVGVRTYAAPGDPKQAVMEFTDDAAGGAGVVRSKGLCNSRISSALFGILEKEETATHFLRFLGEREILVRRLDMFPLQVIVHNVAAGTFAERMGVPEGEILHATVVEFVEAPPPKTARANVRYITDISEGHVKVLQTKAMEVNHALRRFFKAAGLVLVETALTFGQEEGGFTRLAGELTPDTCRLWDRTDHAKLDKEQFRDITGGEEAYQEVLKRIARAAGASNA